MTTPTPGPWRFFRSSGLEQARIETGADLESLESLDQRLWVALACPVRGLEIDERTLALADTDGDQRLRVPEVLAAIRFCRERLRSLDGLPKRSPELPLASIDEGRPEGQLALSSAKAILASLGKPTAESISVDDVTAAAASFSKARNNGDGVVTPASTDDPALRAVIADALATVGGVPDRSGDQGLSKERLDTFYAELESVHAWAQEAEADASLRPLGDGTAAAAAAVAAIKAKVDDYFARCRLAKFDSAAAEVLNASRSRYEAAVTGDLSADAGQVAGLPLAHVRPDQPLPLNDGANPAWRAAVESLARDAATPLLGRRDALAEADWLVLQERLAPHVAWIARKPATNAHALGLARVRELRTGGGRAALEALVAQDASFAATFDAIVQVERLVRYHRDLFALVNNFVSFEAFYSRREMAVFQAGTLFLDSRACDLCVRVEDAAKHAALAGLSKCYLAYCDLTRAGGEKMQIVAVFSGGDSDYLMVGRNGVFYDRKGRDWDATITRIVDNPISIRQAFFAPYKKFVRFVEEQVTKRAAAADAEATSSLSDAAQRTATVDKAQPPAGGKLDLSTIALVGVAVSGAAAVIGGLLQAFFGLGAWMPLGFAGLVLAISGPSMAIAALKLRQRNLGPVLEANGWAINGRVNLNIPFGGSLTRLQEFPTGAQRAYVDTYQPARGPWGAVLSAALVLVAIAGTTWVGYHRDWLPGGVESRLAFLGVPRHLVTTKVAAGEAVVEAQGVLASAQEQTVSATKALADLVAAGEPDGPRLERARARLQRAEAKLARAQDRLDKVEDRLEGATEALEVAVDTDEARVAANDAAADLAE